MTTCEKERGEDNMSCSAECTSNDSGGSDAVTDDLTITTYEGEEEEAQEEKNSSCSMAMELVSNDCDGTEAVSDNMTMSSVQEEKRDNESYSPVEFAMAECGRADSPSPFCCIFSTNMRNLYDFPELIAVDCETAAREDVTKCLNYVASLMANSKMVLPNLFRFTLRMDNTSSNCSYFACLHLSETKHLDAIYEHYMGSAVRPKAANLVLLLMPIVPRTSTSSHLWGQIPPAPNNNERMRDHIKEILEDMAASPCGIVRSIGGKSRKKQRRQEAKTGRVKLGKALENPEWVIEWEDEVAGLKPREIQYMKKHAAHFIAMSIDGIDPECAANYVAKVFNHCEGWAHLYMKGKTIEAEP